MSRIVWIIILLVTSVVGGIKMENDFGGNAVKRSAVSASTIAPTAIPTIPVAIVAAPEDVNANVDAPNPDPHLRDINATPDPDHQPTCDVYGHVELPNYPPPECLMPVPTPEPGG